MLGSFYTLSLSLSVSLSLSLWSSFLCPHEPWGSPLSDDVWYVGSDMILGWFEGPILEMLKWWRTINQSLNQTDRQTEFQLVASTLPLGRVEWKCTNKSFTQPLRPSLGGGGPALHVSTCFLWEAEESKNPRIFTCFFWEAEESKNPRIFTCFFWEAEEPKNPRIFTCFFWEYYMFSLGSWRIEESKNSNIFSGRGRIIVESKNQTIEASKRTNLPHNRHLLYIVLYIHSQLTMYLTQGFGNQRTSHPVYGNNSHI